MEPTIKMTATGRYPLNFFKVKYIIIQAILNRKSMKNIIVNDMALFSPVNDEKNSVFIRLLTVKDNSGRNLRTSQPQLPEKAVSVKSMKKFIVNDEKKFRVYKAFDRKR